MSISASPPPPLTAPTPVIPLPSALVKKPEQGEAQYYPLRRISRVYSLNTHNSHQYGVDLKRSIPQPSPSASAASSSVFSLSPSLPNASRPSPLTPEQLFSQGSPPPAGNNGRENISSSAPLQERQDESEIQKKRVFSYIWSRLDALLHLLKEAPSNEKTLCYSLVQLLKCYYVRQPPAQEAVEVTEEFVSRLMKAKKTLPDDCIALLEDLSALIKMYQQIKNGRFTFTKEKGIIPLIQVLIDAPKLLDGRQLKNKNDLKTLTQILKRDWKLNLHNYCTLALEEIEPFIANQIINTIQIRRTLAGKLFLSRLDLHDDSQILTQEDLSSWASLYTLGNQLLLLASISSSPILDELIYRIYQPISQQDFIEQVFTEDETGAEVHRLLSKLPGKIPSPSHQIQDWKQTKVLGQGGFKTVYKTHHVAKNIFSALAITKIDLNPKTLKTAKKEVDLMLQLKSKKEWAQLHRVTYIPVMGPSEIISLQQGIQMECYKGDGKKLLKLLKEEPKYNTLLNKIQIVKTLALALYSLHYRLGHVHHDVKIGNILFHINPEQATTPVVMADLGIARPLGRGRGGCTLAWAPLEFLTAREQDAAYEPLQGIPKPNFFKEVATPQMDIYGLGLIAYSLFIGSNPHHPALTDNPIHGYSQSLVISDLKKEWFKEPDVNTGLEHFIWRMCNNNLRIRPSSMKEVILKLDGIT